MPSEESIQKSLEAKARGNEAFAKRDFAAAIPHFTEAIGHDPTNHVFFSNRSACYASTGMYTEALADAEKCVELKPDWAKGYSRKGAALSFLRRYDEAETAYAKGLEADPSNAQLKSGLEEAKRARVQYEQASAANPFAAMFQDPAALQALATNPETAALLADPEVVRILEQARTNPNTLMQHIQDPRITKILGALLQAQMGGAGMDPFAAGDEAPQDVPSAAAGSTHESAAAEPAPEEEPEEDESQLTEEERAERAAKREAESEKQAGNAAYKAKNFDDAIAHYTKAFELDDKNVSYLTNRAAAKFEKGDLEGCVADCEEAIAQGRTVHADYQQIAKAYERKGNAYMKTKRFDEAVEAYDAALTEHRTDRVYAKLKEAKRAKKRAEEDAYINPEIALKEKEAGNELFKAGDFVGALRKYEEAIRRNPADHLLYSNRSATFMKLGRLPEALKDCEKCLEIDPTFIKAYARKGDIHASMKEHHKALTTYEQGLKIDPENEMLKNGYQRVMFMIQASQGSEADEEQRQRAMADPEIQAILADPLMRTTLNTMQQEPDRAADFLRDPQVADKINKLIAAGVLKVA